MNAMATRLAATANHFICWRSTPRARRNRTTMPAAAESRLRLRTTNEAPTSGSIRSPGVPDYPNGLGTDSKTVRFLIGPGDNAMPTARSTVESAVIHGRGAPAARQEFAVGKQQEHERHHAKRQSPRPALEPGNDRTGGQRAGHCEQRVLAVLSGEFRQRAFEAKGAQQPADGVLRPPRRD